MAQQCSSPNQYFDGLLKACKPCHLRCPNGPPTCQRYCNNTMKGTNAILWTCLGLSLIVSLTLFILMFLLSKMKSEPLKDEFKSTESALQNEANADRDARKESRTGVEILLPRGLEYTVEECTCEDCVKSKPRVDSDHLFPLPAMEEGATILVTTKTNEYCDGLLAAGTSHGRRNQFLPDNSPCRLAQSCSEHLWSQGKDNIADLFRVIALISC